MRLLSARRLTLLRSVSEVLLFCLHFSSDDDAVEGGADIRLDSSFLVTHFLVCLGCCCCCCCFSFSAASTVSAFFSLSSKLLLWANSCGRGGCFGVEVAEGLGSARPLEL